jgi:hypothetical protein
MSWLAKGTIRLISVDPVDKKPDFANVGGFTVSAESQDINFDWISLTGSSEIQEDGLCVIDWCMEEFDLEYFKESNEGSINPDWEKITNGVIDEVYYESGYIVGEEEILIEMDLDCFEIIIYDEKENETTMAFKKEQIETYNTKIREERQNNKKEGVL